jgi:hypothetical protein
MSDLLIPIEDVKPKKKRNEGEHRLSHWVEKLLERVLLEPCWFTAQDHSGAGIGGTDAEQRRRQGNKQQKQKWYGVKPSQLDWRVIQAPIYAEFELKYGNGDTTDGQDTTIRLLVDRGIPTGCFWTLEEVYDFLVTTGFRLHGNSKNILKQISEEYAAAERKAGAKKVAPKSKRSSKPFTPKPSAARMRKSNALRLKYPH